MWHRHYRRLVTDAWVVFGYSQHGQKMGGVGIPAKAGRTPKDEHRKKGKGSELIIRSGEEEEVQQPARRDPIFPIRR